MASIPMSDVAKHKRKKSVWIVIHNDVYDVTSFLNEHPGGADSLLEQAGKDATNAFEDIGHSDDARQMMQKYKIGTLAASDRKTYIEKCRSLSSKASSKSPSGKSPIGKSPSMTRSPQTSRHVQTIIVPLESNRWKYILLATLATALVAGIVYKKKYAS